MKHIKKKFSFERPVTDDDKKSFKKVGIQIGKEQISGRVKIPKNYQAILNMLEWDRKHYILPFMEFIFASGYARNIPELWLDGKSGETLYKEPYTERIMRKKISEEVIMKDR